MSEQDIKQQLASLLRRIEDIEARLDSRASTEGQSVNQNEPTPQAPPPPVVVAGSETERQSHAETTTKDPSNPDDSIERDTAATAPKTPPTTLHPVQPPAVRPPTIPQRLQGMVSNITFENLVGGRLYAIIGSLLVIIAAGTLLKLAWDAELFNLLPDQLKCILAAAFGAGLMFAGEVARRRISAWASIGLTTAGLGVFYATSYAAWGIFRVVPEPVGFIFLVGTSALGIVLGTRARLVSVAALSLVGGYLSPLMFANVEASPYTLPVYLIALLLVGLVLCARSGGAYALLRSISWWGTIGFGTLWLLMNGVASPAAHMVFIACVWAAIQLELVYSAARSQLSTASDPSDDPDAADLASEWTKIRPIASSITTTAWAIAMALLTFHEKGIESGLWLIPTCLAVALIGLSAFNVGMRLVLCARPTTDLHRLATVFVTEAGALVFVAVAIAFKDWTAVVAWTALGVGAVVAGQCIRSRGLVVYGIVTQAIGGTNLMLLKWWMVTVVESDVMGGFVITRGTVLMGVSALGWLITGGLIRRSSAPGTEWRYCAHFLMGLGITMSFLGFLNDQSTMLHATWVLLLLTAMIMIVGTCLASDGMRGYGVFVMVLTFIPMMAGQWWEAPAGLELAGITFTSWWWPMMALSGLAFASGLLGSRVRRDPWPKAAIGLMVYGMAVLFLSFIHDETALTSLIVVWLMLSGGAIAVHTVRPQLALSRIGLAGTLLAIIPWLISVSDVRWSEQDDFLIFTHGLWWMLLVVAGICTAAILERRLNQGNTGSRRWSEIAIGLATLLVFVTSSLEVEKLAADLFTAQSGVRAAVSIWWGLFAIGLLVLGFVRDNALLRYAGLSLLALAAAKAVIYDLASVSALWRAMSFLILGLLMLGVGVGYARAMSKLKQTDGHDSPPPDETSSE